MYFLRTLETLKKSKVFIKKKKKIFKSLEKKNIYANKYSKNKLINYQ